MQARIEEFEGKHFGIYFDLTVLTQEEALEKMQAGEFPDILSFPSTMQLISEPDALQVEKEGLDADLIKTGEMGGTQRAVPYCTGGAVFLCNEELIYASEDLLPPDGLPTMEWLQDAQEAGIGLARVKGTSAADIATAEVDQEVALQLLQAPETDWQSVATGETAMAVAGLGDLCSILSRAQSENTTLTVTPLSHTAVQVQYVAIYCGEEKEKASAAAGWCSYLLTEKVQKRLPDNYSFPIRTDLVDLLPEDFTMAKLYELRRGESIHTISLQDRQKLEEELQNLQTQGASAEQIYRCVKSAF